jgi:hypothetical protein
MNLMSNLDLLVLTTRSVASDAYDGRTNNYKSPPLSPVSACCLLELLC